MSTGNWTCGACGTTHLGLCPEWAMRAREAHGKPKGGGISEAISLAAQSLYQFTMRNREYFINAFVAKTGLQPDECVMVEEESMRPNQEFGGMVHVRRVWFELKESKS